MTKSKLVFIQQKVKKRKRKLGWMNTLYKENMVTMPLSFLLSLTQLFITSINKRSEQRVALPSNPPSTGPQRKLTISLGGHPCKCNVSKAFPRVDSPFHRPCVPPHTLPPALVWLIKTLFRVLKNQEMDSAQYL